ncbi:MAG TPA: ABC transporter permease [Methylomirabilota bacterium]|nr:ABC transporter permease [Methylomirabilota bacterium]
MTGHAAGRTAVPGPPPRWARLGRRLQRLPAMLAVVVLVALTLVASGAPVLAPHDPFAQNLDGRLAPPAWAGGTPTHWLGTDQLGRDILSRLIFGARVSLIVALMAVVIAGVTGVVMGLLAGYYGGLVDEVLMRLADLRMALPFILLVIALIAVFGPSLVLVIAILGLTGWVAYARVLRAEVLSLREREFVVAARALGATDLRLVFRHILPNGIASAIVIASLELAQMIVVESSLSFLGLGVQPPTPSWGNMLGEGRDYVQSKWWLATFPGLAIALTTVSVNLVGDWLRDRLDPHLQVSSG